MVTHAHVTFSYYPSEGSSAYLELPEDWANYTAEEKDDWYRAQAPTNPYCVLKSYGVREV